MQERDILTSPEKLKFTTHPVVSRKDLLHFVAETLNPEIYKDLGKNPKRWLEELNIIQGMLTGKGLTAFIDFNLPPQEEPDFDQIGENIFLYRGERGKFRGLWLREKTTTYDWEGRKEVPHTQWTHYGMGTTGMLYLNPDFKNVPMEAFLPENFEPKSKMVKSDKRPILVFEIPMRDKVITVYAKGAYVETSHLYEPPSYRLTNLAGVAKITSREEMERNLELARCEVKVPPVLGYYDTPFEEFLFLQKIEGGNPLDFLESHRKAIIKQDAEMLAVLCLLGYRKAGFEDFDDKIFDGQDLYLIDTEEIRDLYAWYKLDFRRILLNPSDTTALNEFREMQKSIFKKVLKDCLFNYRVDLTPTLDAQVLYIVEFYQRVGWGAPTEPEIKELLTFPEGYITSEQELAMMTEE